MVNAGKLELSVEASVNKSQLRAEIEKAAKMFENALNKVSFAPGMKSLSFPMKQESTNFLNANFLDARFLNAKFLNAKFANSSGLGTGGKGGSGGYGGSGSSSGGTTSGSSTDSFKRALSSSLRIFKIDLFWRWIKGTWSTITKYVPLIGALSNILNAILGLLFTALLLPFLPQILGVLKWLLQKSVDFFKYMQSLSGLSPSEIAKKITADINNFFKTYDWAGEGAKLGTAINNAITFVKDFLTKINWEQIGTSIGTFITNVVKKMDGFLIGTTIAAGINALVRFTVGMFSSIDWVVFGEKIGEGLVSAILNIDWIKVGELLFRIPIAMMKLSFGLSSGVQKGVQQGTGLDLFGLTPPGMVYNGLNSANKVFGFADGGRVPGIGSRDTVPAMLTPGETVTPKGQVGNVNINVNGIMDASKIKDMIRSEVNQALRGAYAVRGGTY